MTSLLRLSLLLLSAVILGVGCKRDEQSIRAYDAPKDQPAAPAAMPMAQLPPDAAAPKDRSLVQWTLPEGWKEVPGQSAMRYATIQLAPDDPKALLTVVPLPLAAQQLEPNLRRWAGQLNLPADADLNKYVAHVPVGGQSADVVDMTSPPRDSGHPGQSILVALVPHGEQMWFFKIEASAPVVEAQKSKFATFLQSVRFGGSGEATAGSPAPPANSAESAPASDAAPGLARFAAPAGWTRQPNPNAMRVLSFKAGAAEVSVVKLPAGAFGGWQDNINRWRGQVGLAPVDDANSVHPDNVPMGDKQGQLFDFTGPQAPQGAAQRMLVGYLERAGTAWFFKLTGPADAVAAQKSAFADFLKSIQFE